ncbi:MAG TPA: class I SAM-dependent methyltransferase [Patescibacteria group bacterium]|nr:class I SAM-dependent methyltransferase [Patescibacteria group bacterium]
MDIFSDLHLDVNREGPGCLAATREAYRMLAMLPPVPRILDIGCGSGVQTLELARLSGGYVVGLDMYRPLLDMLELRSRQAGLEERVQTVKGSMFAMDFDPASFDIIWAEGAICIIGFAEGLRQWRHFLKPGGYIAVTEVSWLKPDPPAEVVRFWRQSHPGMRSVSENLTTARDAGYREIGHFTLSRQAWWDEYHRPLQARLEELRPRYAHDEQVLAVFEAISRELELNLNYSEWFGYEFYVLQSI